MEDTLEQQAPPGMVKYFGKHVILDFFNCDRKRINDPKLVEKFMVKSVKLVGMKIINGPFTQFYNHPTDPGESGVTSVVVLAESHASFHGMERSGLVCMDLFSCKDFDAQKLIDLFVKTFKPQGMHYTPLSRGMDYGHEKHDA